MVFDAGAIRVVLDEQKEDLRRFLETTRLVQRERQLDFDVLLGSKLISVILGVRRSGKSTICAQLDFAGVGYVNFDDERLIGVKAADLNRIYEVLLQSTPNMTAIVFDEIQNVAGWELFVNRLQRKGLKLIVTGSNGQLLGRELSTHLTGRHLSLELFPFSFGEYLRFHHVETPSTWTTEHRASVKARFDEYVVRGGFPEVVQGEHPGPYLRELFDRIISRDVLQRRALKSSKALKELALYLVQNPGCLVSYQRLARTFEFKSVHTLKSYVGFLEETYLVQELLAYSNKIRERLTMPRKI